MLYLDSFTSAYKKTAEPDAQATELHPRLCTIRLDVFVPLRPARLSFAIDPHHPVVKRIADHRYLQSSTSYRMLRRTKMSGIFPTIDMS